MNSLRVAKEKGMTVSFDGNFRSALWTWEEARDFCTQCLPYIDVLMGIEPYHLWKDEADHSQGDIKDGVSLQPSYEQQDEIFNAFFERYPNLKCIARHVRYAHSGSENSLPPFLPLAFASSLVRTGFKSFCATSASPPFHRHEKGTRYSLMQPFSEFP